MWGSSSGYSCSSSFDDDDGGEEDVVGASGGAGGDDVDWDTIQEDEEWVLFFSSFLLFLVLYAKGGKIRGVNNNFFDVMEGAAARSHVRIRLE